MSWEDEASGGEGGGSVIGRMGEDGGRLWCKRKVVVDGEINRMARVSRAISARLTA